MRLPRQPPPAWRRVRFLDRFDAWAAVENPSPELRRYTYTWIFSRGEDPYSNAHRERGFEDLWYCVLPSSRHGDDRWVVCSYWIDPLASTVTCDNFGSLTLPID